MEFTLEKFAEMKKNYLEMIVQGTKEAGGLPPHLTLFGSHIDDDEKQAIIHIPIQDELMQPEGKVKLFEKVIPMLAEKVKEKFNIYALAWSSEAWIREGGPDRSSIDNWRDLPIKKEVIVVNFESTVKNEFIMYDLVRNGHKVSDEGDLIDNIELTEVKHEGPGTSEGNLTGLLKKFQDYKK